MVFGLILLICVIVMLAFFIGFNLNNSCNLWFFHSFENIPVYLLVLIAFASGIIFSILCLLISKLRTPSKPVAKKSPAEKSTKDKINNRTSDGASKKINKKKSLLKKAEKIADKSDNDSDATIVADPKKLEKK